MKHTSLFRWAWRTVHLIAFTSLLLYVILSSLKADGFFPFPIEGPLEIEGPIIENVERVDEGPWECLHSDSFLRS
jgi:hypothetical protein